MPGKLRTLQELFTLESEPSREMGFPQCRLLNTSAVP
jgi:hypothetical protein